jgi:hypothetical protein
MIPAQFFSFTGKLIMLAASTRIIGIFLPVGIADIASKISPTPFLITGNRAHFRAGIIARERIMTAMLFC